MKNETSEQRTRAHAKLFDTERGQVLVYLNRDDNDDLTINLQMWVATTDEPLRALIRAQNEAHTQAIFDSIEDDSLAQLLEELGLLSVLAEVEVPN